MDLKELRLKKGLTQKNMADKLNMTINNYCNYERKIYPSMKLEIENKISEILKCEFKYLEE